MESSFFIYNRIDKLDKKMPGKNAMITNNNFIFGSVNRCEKIIF